jgi:hypothetical protein
MAVSGVGLGMATAGGVLLWSGLSGVTPVELVKSLSTGQQLPPVTVGTVSQLVKGFIAQLGSAIGSAIGSAVGSAVGSAGSAGGDLIGGLAATLADSPSVGASGAAPGALGSLIAARAEQYLGVPYVWGGASPSGWDCSGFVTYLLHHDFGLSLPDNGHTTSEVFYVWSGARTIARSECQAGDLVCWMTHIAIATGPDTCVGAENARLGTISGQISNMGPGGETYLIRRIIPQGAGAPSAASLAV